MSSLATISRRARRDRTSSNAHPWVLRAARTSSHTCRSPRSMDVEFSGRGSRGDPDPSTLSPDPQLVSHSTDCEDVFGGAGIALDLLAQVADVHLEHFGVAVEVAAPGEVQQVIVRHDLARVQHQTAQQLVL